LNYLYGFPTKIIWIRTGNIKTSEIVRIIMENLKEIKKLQEEKKLILNEE